MRQNLSIVSVILAICILLSCTVTGASAASSQEPQQPFYVHYPVTIIMAGLPKTIKAQFDYDRDFIDIVPDYPDIENYPSYNGVGFTFPLATEEYGSLYDVSYTVDDTVISYTYTLKSGVTFDAFLDALDAVNEKTGAIPEYRAEGARREFPIFDIAMKVEDTEKLDAVFFAKVVDNKMLEVVTADGRSLDVTSNYQNSEVYCRYPIHSLPDPNAPVPTEAEEPDYLYRDKLFSQYSSEGVNEYTLATYDECYTHTDANGEVDWAIVIAQTEPERSLPGWTNPAYYEFGNRVLDIEDRYEPFAFGMGVYSAKYDRFFDVYAPELYELQDIERVWTEIGAGRLMGDMDGDNELTVADATLIQRCEAKMMDYPEDDVNIPSDMVDDPITYFSDFDQDGERSITDVTAIQRYLAYMNYRPASWTPYPHTQQPDPTEPAPTEPEPTEVPTVAPTEAPTDAPTEAPTEAPTTQPEPDPSIPRITGFKSTGFGVEISLSTVEGAEKYRVYYKNENDNWVKLGETTGKTFTHSDVTVGTAYTYTVRCVKADNSAFTSDFDRTGWTYTYDPHLATPQITRIEAANDGAKITWAPVEGADLYRVYYKHNGWTKIVDTRETSAVHTGITNSQTLTYTVRCLAAGGNGFASDFDRNGTPFHLESTPDLSSMEAHLDGVSFIVHGDYSPGDIAVYRKEASGWKRIGTVPPLTRFTDTDVVPGKTYTYTCRCLSEDGSYFISKFNTKGWSQKFTVDQCIPEFEFVMFDATNNSVVVQVKENKFGIEQFGIEVYLFDDYLGTYVVGTDSYYLEGDFWKANRSYDFYVFGLDKDGNVITSYAEDGAYIRMVGAPTNLKAEKTGDRKYRFSWTRGSYNSGYYDLNLYTADGEPVADSEMIKDTYYEVDLSDYPEDTEYICLVYSVYENNPSISMPAVIEFKEADYR